MDPRAMMDWTLRQGMLTKGLARPGSENPATGAFDPTATYGMGGMDQPGDFQPAQNPPMEPSVLEELLAAGELAAQGMTEEAKQLYQRAMWRAQRMTEKPMVQEGLQGAEDLAQRGAGMAEDAYGAVTGMFK